MFFNYFFSVFLPMLLIYLGLILYNDAWVFFYNETPSLLVGLSKDLEGYWFWVTPSTNISTFTNFFSLSSYLPWASSSPSFSAYAIDLGKGFLIFLSWFFPLLGGWIKKLISK